MAAPSPVDNGTLRAYRAYLPDLSQPRFTSMKQQNAQEYAKTFLDTRKPPWIHALYLHWKRLLDEPYKGITNDGRSHREKTLLLADERLLIDCLGHIRRDLFRLNDEEVDIDGIVAATQQVLDLLSPEQRSSVRYHLDAPEWRTWSNPEFLLFDKGLRLDRVSATLSDCILAVLQATLSPEGYQKAMGAMRINGFLGELVESPAVMNALSYNFVLFGAESAVPSATEPWGFSFYGHHLCLNVFLYRRQMVLSPWFTGAEPNGIDSGPYAGTRILHEEERLGLALMQSLDAEKKAQAQTYKRLRDPDMPRGRWNHDDQRHLCGAARDNRIVPYEGILVSGLSEEQVALVEGILEQYLLYLPAPARAIRLQEIRHWFSETYFSWIGGHADDDAFYYRLQSPVVIVEFDHHSGVFLTNSEPKRFHIHTLLRTPNAGDYGYALRPLIPGCKQEFVWTETDK